MKKKMGKMVRTIVIIIMIGAYWFGMFQIFKVSTKIIDTAARLWDISYQMTVYNESSVKTDKATEVAKGLEAKRQRMIHSENVLVSWYANASDFWQATAGIGSVVAIVVVGGAPVFYSYLYFSRKEKKKARREKTKAREEWEKAREVLQKDLDMEDCRKMEKKTIVTNISQTLPERKAEKITEQPLNLLKENLTERMEKEKIVLKEKAKVAQDRLSSSNLTEVDFIKKQLEKMSPIEREKMKKRAKILDFSAMAPTEREKELEIPKFMERH